MSRRFRNVPVAKDGSNICLHFGNIEDGAKMLKKRTKVSKYHNCKSVISNKRINLIQNSPSKTKFKFILIWKKL